MTNGTNLTKKTESLRFIIHPLLCVFVAELLRVSEFFQHRFLFFIEFLAADASTFDSAV